MENVLLIKRISDDRIIDFRTLASGIPLPDTDATSWDSSAYDWVCGVVNYDESIWDTDDTLTDAACATLGLDTSLKAKVIRDLEIDIDAYLEGVGHADDLTYSESGGVVTISESIQSAENRKTYLTIQFGTVSGGGIEDQGVDAYNGLPTWDCVETEATDRLEITVRKYYYEDDSLANEATDTDEVVLRVSGGKIFGAYHKNLVAGTCTFEWQPPVGSGIASATVEAGNDTYVVGKELLSATESIQLLNYSAI